MSDDSSLAILNEPYKLIARKFRITDSIMIIEQRARSQLLALFTLPSYQDNSRQYPANLAVSPHKRNHYLLSVAALEKYHRRYGDNNIRSGLQNLLGLSSY